MNNLLKKRVWLLTCLLLVSACFFSCQSNSSANSNAFDVKAHYTKYEYNIPMRDGVKLYTAVYVPNDSSKSYPFLMKRTPYSCMPYGAENYPNGLGPVGNSRFAEEGYVFVYQDVRGRFMSEGTFLNMTPHISNKTNPQQVDESSDMYDTVDWLLKNVRHNNGRAGIWGISYPGFYTAASIIDSHPAIKAASPQAAIGDWFTGDDFHHRGAFFLLDAFRFFTFFEGPAPNPTDKWGPRFEFNSSNAYDFFLNLGPLRNANEKYFQHKIAFWDSLMQHGNYNAFWQRRNIIPHMKNVTTNVMNVMGYFDAEDPHGPVNIYQSIEKNNPGINNTMVMGPWFHGGWVRSQGDMLGNVSFENSTARYYRDTVDLAFFNFYLKNKGSLNLPEVLAYCSGSNEWHELEAWPPAKATSVSLYFQQEGGLAFSSPTENGDAADSYLSDPANPVPHTSEITINRTREYMVEDQRFAAEREDVLVYQTEVLTEDVTLAGPITANLYISSTGTDADFIVKLIDVYPDDFPEHADKYLDVPMGGYQMLVRAEVMRAKFRNSFEKPEPLVPGETTLVKWDTPDIFHTFKAGHRIMVQVQSSWFPLVDRNPQKFVDIYNAKEADFQAATQTIHRSAKYPSHISVAQVK
ncbi:MAG: CocE/NonD family hydrolase [bacterium]